jgi:hypothetical protein
VPVVEMFPPPSLMMPPVSTVNVRVEMDWFMLTVTLLVNLSELTVRFDDKFCVVAGCEFHVVELLPMLPVL